MKYFVVVILIMLIGFFVLQSFMSRATKNIEMYAYKVVKSFNGFEIRSYKARSFSYITLPSSSYNETSGNGFRALAGYIFGGNDQNMKIAMTSPVAMQMKDSITMMFMVPSEYKLQDLPKPNNPKVQFKEEPEKTVAAIRFSGWANDNKINIYTQKLKELLEQNNIKHNNNFSYLGYNPPFEVTNRRNEIIVEVDY